MQTQNPERKICVTIGNPAWKRIYVDLVGKNMREPEGFIVIYLNRTS